MSGTALMALGTRSMFAAQAALQVTGHNIANASVDGYSRQRVEVVTSAGQFTGAGFFGKGADVANVVRVYDGFLTRQASLTASQAGFDRLRYDRLSQLETVFPMGERGIGHAATQVFNAFVDVASRPQDIPSRQVVLSRAQELVARFNTASGQLDTLQQGVANDLALDVKAVNELAQGIARVNDQIAAVNGLGLPPNDLLDQRDRLIQQLSGYLAVSTVAYEDGSYGVFIAGGEPLVMAGRTTRLAVVDDPADPTRAAIGIVDGGQARLLAPELLSSGSIGGLLQFQNVDLVAARGMLDELAQAFADRMNALQSAGTDLDGQPGAPMFDPPPGTPRAAAALRLLISDPRALAAADATGDNGNALAFAALRDERFVDGTWFSNSTMAEAWASAMGDIGVRVQGARAAAEISGAVAQQAKDARDSFAGVNLDEEAAYLIQYQQAYQAAAKVLQVAQSVFQTLLETAGR
ncbi:MAG: flagellar hook-associated protein FlgK [Rubrivivax sp.]|jgi:flagellar hook-associated protein 1 FlgK|nr:flagellar hook-associated protein FlgK [Rubrivivax sp.]